MTLRGRDITPENHGNVYDYYEDPRRARPGFTRLVFGLSNAALHPIVRIEDPTAISYQHDSGKVAIIASNHPSSWDPFVASAAIHGTRHPAFRDPIGMAKVPLFTNPLTRPLFEYTGCVPVMRRKDVKDAGENPDVLSNATFDMLETIARMALDQGRPIAITPEGTRSGGEAASTLTADRIRDGITKLALLTSGESYIVPMGIYYGHPDPAHMNVAEARNAAVYIGRPITEYADTAEEIHAQVFEAMANSLEQAKLMKGHYEPVTWTRRPRGQENL